MVTRNMTVQTPVMINPTGKMPNVRPGITNPASPAGLVSDPGPREAASCVGENTPLTNDVPLAERSASSGVPSAPMPEKAIVGASRERAESLRRR